MLVRPEYWKQEAGPSRLDRFIVSIDLWNLTKCKLIQKDVTQCNGVAHLCVFISNASIVHFCPMATPNGLIGQWMPHWLAVLLLYYCFRGHKISQVSPPWLGDQSQNWCYSKSALVLCLNGVHFEFSVSLLAAWVVLVFLVKQSCNHSFFPTQHSNICVGQGEKRTAEIFSDVSSEPCMPSVKKWFVQTTLQ